MSTHTQPLHDPESVEPNVAEAFDNLLEARRKAKMANGADAVHDAFWQEHYAKDLAGNIARLAAVAAGLDLAFERYDNPFSAGEHEQGELAAAYEKAYAGEIHAMRVEREVQGICNELRALTNLAAEDRDESRLRP